MGQIFFGTGTGAKKCTLGKVFSNLKSFFFFTKGSEYWYSTSQF